MLLGKRPRPPMKRTTSMTEFTLDMDLNLNGTIDPSLDPHNSFNVGPLRPNDGLDHRFLTSTLSPRNHRRNSADYMETTHFLKACHLCKRRLIPGRDIFMYRGDSAFCSLECRQQQMTQDERKEKCSLASKKQISSSTPTGSEVSTNGAETVAAL